MATTLELTDIQISTELPEIPAELPVYSVRAASLEERQPAIRFFQDLLMLGKLVPVDEEASLYYEGTDGAIQFYRPSVSLWVENLKDNGVTRQRYWGCPIPIWKCENEKCAHIEVIGDVSELKKKADSKIPENLHKPWIDNLKLKCGKCKGKMKLFKQK